MKAGARNQLPVIALSVHWHTYPARLEWAVDQGFAIEYSPNPLAFALLSVHLGAALEAGVPVRHHGFFPRHEIGHIDAATAEQAVRVHISALEAMQGLGEQVITVHIGLNSEAPLDPGRAVTNLSRVVAHAQGLGITVCLENLRRGPTSDPETVVAWARESGAMITLDVGHAVSCQRVQSGELSPVDFVDAFTDRLWEVHMYERETDRHYPPQDMTVLGPIVDRLLTTSCRWWTIELSDDDEALATRALLVDYLHAGQR
jgi:sugar phosphate isomerase/epimerase